ncbi:hypothetical protein V2J09_023764 [Rumex salicifolius]
MSGFFLFPVLFLSGGALGSKSAFWVLAFDRFCCGVFVLGWSLVSSARVLAPLLWPRCRSGLRVLLPVPCVSHRSLSSLARSSLALVCHLSSALVADIPCTFLALAWRPLVASPFVGAFSLSWSRGASSC